MPERRSDLQALEKFAGETDRYLTNNFVGRKSETERILTRARTVQKRRNDAVFQPAAGATMLIQGAPGAGKTSLLQKLRSDWLKQDDKPDIITIQVASLHSSQSLEGALRRNAKYFSRSSMLRLLSVFKGFSLLGADVSLDPPEPGDPTEDALERIKHPIIFFVDEIQNVPQTQFAASFLQRLHEGDQTAPIIPIYAGLAHSKTVLSRAGISRLSGNAVISLGRLSEDETRESADKFFSTCGVCADAQLINRWKDMVQRESQGWPHHLHNTLQSIGEMLIEEPNGDLAMVSEDDVRRRSSAMRANYYTDRLDGRLSRPKVLIGRFMAGITGDGASAADCIDLIDSLQVPGATTTSLPEGMTADGVFDLFVAKGLLQESAEERGVYLPPIPSMRNWCIAAAGGRLHSATMMGDAVVVWRRLQAGDDIDSRDALDRTPLHIAAEEGWPEIYDLLLKSGADAQAKDKHGRTPVEAGRGIGQHC